MNWRPKNYGGSLVSGGSGFSYFLELRALSVIAAFVLYMVLLSGSSSSDIETVKENYELYKEVLFFEALVILLLGFLGEILPRFTLVLITVVTGVTVGLISLVEGEFFHGKDLIFIYNILAVVLAYWGFLRKNAANKR